MPSHLWQKLEIAGRAAMIVALTCQLTILTQLQDVKARGELIDLQENQAVLAYMIMHPANAVEEYGKRFMLYSEAEKSRRGLEREVSIMNNVFIVLFLLGGVLELTGRYFELQHATAEPTSRQAPTPQAPATGDSPKE